jgi:P pilus assembly chaperone PapD
MELAITVKASKSQSTTENVLDKEKTMKKIRNLRKGLLSVLVCLGLLAATIIPAYATLLIMPVWIIFKDRERTANITLVNTTNEESLYRIEWRYQKQNETGAYDILDGPIDPAHDPSKMVLFSPRQVTLPPKGKQRIRLSLRRPPDLPDGEYRAHLVMTRIDTTKINPEKPEEKGKIRVIIGMNVGYSLPVIIRQGAYNSTAAISNPHFVSGSADGKNPPELKITLTRSGLYSTMGGVKVYWSPPGQSERVIGELNNVNIYAELAKREIGVKLNEKQIAGGNLRVVYEGQGPDKGVIFDEKTIPVGG